MGTLQNIPAQRRHAPLVIAALFAIALPLGAQDTPSAQEILARVDENQAFDSIQYRGRMEIRLGAQLRVKTMRAWAQSPGKAFIEFTNPEDSGTRMLKLGEDLWMFFPKEADTVRISGHLLKGGMMGSDVSYEDAMESDRLLETYTASVLGAETLDGRPVWVLELKAKTKAARYDRRVLRVDAERYVVLAEDMYARSGTLIKTSQTLAVIRVGGRWYPATVVVSDKLRKDSSTTMVLEDIILDAAIDPSVFTRANLES